MGNLSSGKSALVHRYLTGTYVQEESPEGEVQLLQCSGHSLPQPQRQPPSPFASPAVSGPHCLLCPSNLLTFLQAADLRRRLWWMVRATCCSFVMRAAPPSSR